MGDSSMTMFVIDDETFMEHKVLLMDIPSILTNGAKYTVVDGKHYYYQDDIVSGHINQKVLDWMEEELDENKFAFMEIPYDDDLTIHCMGSTDEFEIYAQRTLVTPIGHF